VERKAKLFADYCFVGVFLTSCFTPLLSCFSLVRLAGLERNARFLESNVAMRIASTVEHVSRLSTKMVKRRMHVTAVLPITMEKPMRVSIVKRRPPHHAPTHQLLAQTFIRTDTYFALTMECVRMPLLLTLVVNVLPGNSKSRRAETR
jgi:hypothetical protein